jgi:hypothetical protein
MLHDNAISKVLTVKLVYHLIGTALLCGVGQTARMSVTEL